MRFVARLSPCVVGVVVSGCGDGEPTGPGPDVEEPAGLVSTTADDGPGSLRRMIAEAEPGAVIRFDTEGIFGMSQEIELDGALVLDRDVSIVGPGADLLTVGAADRSRVFRIEGATAAISGLTITEGVAPFENIVVLGTPATARLGGCVFVGSGSELTLDAVVVTGCVLPFDVDAPIGAGIMNFEGTLSVSNSRIEGNSAILGAGVAGLSLGATEAATTTIEGGILSGNEGGAVFSLRSFLIIRGTTITDNDVGVAAFGDGDSFGGGTVTLEDVTIQNQLRSGFAIEEGVRAFVRRAVITGNEGAGIESSGELTVESSTVSDNALGLSLRDGSGIISRSVVSGNGAIGGDPGRTSRGGGIYVGGSSTSLQITDSTRIEGNQADAGGGVFVSNGRLTVRASTISSNAGTEGGGIFAERDASVVLDGAAVVDNEARDGSGGGIRFDMFDLARLTLAGGSRVSGNTAALDGGGIDLSGSGGKATLEDGDVTDNQAGRFGGGIRVRDARLDMLGGSGVERNTAEQGGGIDLMGGRIEMSESATIVANRATGDGGGVHVQSGFFLVDASFCVILGNRADLDDDGDGAGGGIFHSSGATLRVPAERVCLNDPDDITSG